MKRITALLFLFIPMVIICQDIPIKTKVANLQKRISQERQLHSELKIVLDNIETIKKEDESIRKKAVAMHNENLAKIGGKGFLDLIGGISRGLNPVNAAVDFAVRIASQMAEESMGNTGGKYYSKNVDLNQLQQVVKNMKAEGGVIETNEILMNMIKEDLSSFHSNLIALPNKYPEIKKFWSENYNNDDEIEKITRKLNVIQHYAKKGRDQAQEQMTIVGKQLSDLNQSIIANKAELNRLKGMVDDWDPTPVSNPEPKPEISRPITTNENRWAWCTTKMVYGGEHATWTPEEEECYKMYYKNGYRYDTRIVTNFPAEVVLHRKSNRPLTVEYENEYIDDLQNVYSYQHYFIVDGEKQSIGQGVGSRLREPGMHSVTVVLLSCKEIIDVVERKVLVTDPISEAIIYFKDPPSEMVWMNNVGIIFKGVIECPGIEKPEQKLKYNYKILYDGKEEVLVENARYIKNWSPPLDLLTVGKHEIRIQLFDRNDQFVDQYLHHLTVLPQEGHVNIPPAFVPQPANSSGGGKIEEQTYDQDMEGKRENTFATNWASYDYVFKGGKIYIDGWYYWNYKKVNYTSEPVLNYQKGSKTVPGMLLTKTSGYHIYPTTTDAGAVCQNYIITQMKGSDISILHRIQGCDFFLKPSPDQSSIEITYREGSAGPKKTITLY